MEETVPLPPRPAYSTIAGILLDKETGEPVVSASVIAQGTSLGNITNQNGEFRLNLPDSLRRCMLSFSHLGYVGQTSFPCKKCLSAWWSLKSCFAR